MEQSEEADRKEARPEWRFMQRYSSQLPLWVLQGSKECLNIKLLMSWECGVISEHTKKMCTRSLRCPQHTDEQRRSVRVYLLGPSASLPETEGSVENDSFDVAENQALMSRLQWDGSSDISPSDSASSKTSTNNSESRKTKKKKPHMSLVGGAPGMSSNKKKLKPKPLAPPTPSLYDDIN
uniref:Uncharacterized protein n=1 Tax=Sphaerodactylus townsendi TaxID=933632 RepID=A0ACB8EU12_9SAUR